MKSSTPPPQVYDRIVAKVFSGEFEPGSKITERDLANEFKVSRMPVRTALSQLVAQGILVGGQKQRSIRMRDYSPREIADLYQFREIIECGAVRAAGQRATAQQLAEIDHICDQMQAEVENLQFDDRWSNLDHAYHESFARASGNDWLIQSISTLMHMSHYVLYCLRWKLQPDLSDDEIRRRKQHNVNVHRQVVACIRAGDIDGAEETMRGHIRRSVLKSASAKPLPEAAMPVSRPPQTPRNTRSRKAGAFTLIELLVVISIISLLIAILLPALQSARVSAYMSQSLSNLRQISIATQGYASDAKSSMPFTNYRLNSGGGGVPPTWAGILREGNYVSSIKLYWSPARDISAIADTMPIMDTVHWGSNVNGFNVHEGWQSSGYGSNTYAMPLFSENRAPLKLGHSNVPPHSNFITFTETWQRLRIAGYYHNSGDYRDLNSSSRIFTINGGAARAYLDGHASGSKPDDIGWQADDAYNGRWLYTSIGQLNDEPWNRNWWN